MTLDGLAYRARPAEGEPAGALVLLHGRGADEHDLFPLLDALDPGRRLAAFCPRGPLSLPPGGAHWYSVRAIGYPDPGTFQPTFELLAGWLDELPGLTGLPIGQTVIGGFSQGAVMSFAAALGPGRPTPAGVIALSGFVPTVPGWEPSLDRPGLPVAIGHGTNDAVIGVEWGRQARDLLTSAGADVTYRESPIAHAIDPGLLAALPAWITQTLEARVS